MNDRLVNTVLPLLDYQRRTGKRVSLDECVAEADFNGVRRDLVVLLVRHELPIRESPGLSRRFVTDVALSNFGAIRRSDEETIEALHLVALALGQTLTVRVI